MEIVPDHLFNEPSSPTASGEGGDRPEIARNKKVIVVGSGVIGLTTAIRLLEDGYDVEIWAKDIPGKVSELASFWEPFASVPDSKKRDRRWGKDTYDKLQTQTRAGVPGLAVFPGLTIMPGESDPPDWADYVTTYQHLNTRDEVAQSCKATGVNLPDHAKSGYTVTYPTFDMTKYLPYLIAEFTGKGGKIIAREIGDLSEPLDQADTVINCTGVASRELLSDFSTYPIRGNLVKVTKPQDVNHVVIDDYGPQGMRNVMPHENHIMLGGTAERDKDESVNEVISGEIVDRCRELVPALKDSHIISHHTGLRPFRERGIRLEMEDTGIIGSDGKSNKVVIHNYGHGGSGVTFSWGCANEVAEMLKG